MTEKQDLLQILCPFCNAVFSMDMDDELNKSVGCETCGVDYNWQLEIVCTNCSKVVYKK